MKEEQKAEIRAILKNMDELIGNTKAAWNDEAGAQYAKLLGREYEALQAFLRNTEEEENNE